MVFNSVQYFVLLAVVCALYWGLRGRRRARILVLLAASYVFYGAWDWRFTSLLALSSVVDYTVALRMEATDDAGRRRRLLLVSLAVNLGVLGFFKYFGFFVESAAALLEAVGMRADPPVLRIVLPVGISFYTFQTMAYTIDVYQRRFHAIRDFPVFATYVAFFPQLVAGPIERARRLLPQLQDPPHHLEPNDVTTGVALIGLGLFKKIVIADALAPVVDEVFASPEGAGWVAAVVATYAFALQIYADFSGYSDIARGSARLLGIRLVRNFEQPYLSRNITEFWRTWHISLSQWLRDYLYIPLGGNRRGPRRTMINLALTMLLGGLWHGAAWTFVFWGGLHGAYLAVHRLWRRRTPADTEPLPRGRDIWRVVGTFHLVCLAWVFFRADSFTAAATMLARVATFAGGQLPVDGLPLVLLAGAVMLAIDIEQRRTGMHVPHLQRPWVRGALAGAATAGVLLFSGQAAVPFLYFQF
jgi:D-alanyl-lipoteichoic acid acyltransferase DltB (MBOAT superfamily)